MTDLVNPSEIETIVGAKRDLKIHIGRLVAEDVLYILHSQECVDSGIDLRECEYSLSLDLGLSYNAWAGWSERAVELLINVLDYGQLVPIELDRGDAERLFSD